MADKDRVLRLSHQEHGIIVNALYDNIISWSSSKVRLRLLISAGKSPEGEGAQKES
jgi:hypothetical protein